METSFARRSLLFLAIGEIISLVITIIFLSLRIANNTAVGWIAFLSMVALLFTMFGLIRLRVVNKQFANAFMCLFGELMCFLLEGIFGIVYVKQNAAWAFTLSSVCSTVEIVLYFFNVFFVIRGCKLLAEDTLEGKFLNTSLVLFLIVTAIYFVANIALCVPAVYNDRVGSISLLAVSLVASVFASLLYLYALFNTRLKLE